MKKIIVILVLLVVLVSIFFFGCKKENVIGSTTDSEILKSPMSNELKTLYNTLPTPNYGNITLINRDILRFESVEHFEQVYEDLYEHYQAWAELFIATYDTGNEEELDDIIDSLNFNENWPLFKFEESFKKGTMATATLLEKNLQRELAWLDEGARGLSPSDVITSCPVEQALLSPFYEYCIGDTICQIRPDNYQILIPLSELSSLSYIRNASISELLSRGPSTPTPEFPAKIVLNDPPIVIIDPPSKGCHEKNYIKRNEKYNTSDYKFEWEYFCRNCTYPFYMYTRIKTTVSMKNYKWKAKTKKWVKDYGSPCRIAFVTQLYEYYFDNDDCIKGSTLSKTGSITKVFSKSKRDSKQSEIMGPFPGFGYPQSCLGYLTHNPAESTLTIRHRGTDFHINLKTGQ